MWPVLCPVSPVLCLQCVCHWSCISVSPKIHGNFVSIIIEININQGYIINNNLILPFFCRALIYYCNNLLLDYNNLLLDYNNLLPDYNNPIIIYYYYNPRININPSCPVIIIIMIIKTNGRITAGGN